MYATAHRVRSPQGVEGVNAFLHKHGPDFSWPSEPWRLPEENPGRIVIQKVAIEPGGNNVRSYLDVIAPDDVEASDIEAVFAGLSLELMADEVPSSPLGHLPNPVVYHRGRVVLRLGVEGMLESTRTMEMDQLRQALVVLLNEDEAVR
jgi:hypothetical protein